MKILLFLFALFISCGESDYKDNRCPTCPQQPGPGPGPINPGPVQPCGVTFADIQPILTRACVSCHAGYDQYQDAAGRIDAHINRINLPLSDPRHMPKGGDLAPAEKQLFQQFKDNGSKERCDSTGGAGISPSLDYIETNILNDLNNNPFDRQDFRYLIVQGAEDPTVGRQSINKTINSLSLESRLAAAVPIDQAGQILRIDLDDYGLTNGDWNLIELNDSLKFESFTPNGQLIKAITNTRLPWLHQNNFAFISHAPDTYYSLLQIPINLNDFLRLPFINVDFVDQVNNLEVDYIGFNGSPISLNKNRLIARNRSQFGYMWTTYDVFDVQDPGRNLFQSPFLPETGSNNVFQFQGSEIIFTLPNGLQGFVLFDGEGNRINFAPTDLVGDNEGIDPEIENALDCQRCHSAGIINAEDQIRATVSGNPVFGARDQQLAQLLFTDNEQALINADNQFFAENLRRLEINPSVDPISPSTDLLRSDYTLAKLASLTFLDTQTLSTCIQSSAVLSGTIGQLIRGGTVTFEQIQVSFEDIKRDCFLGREVIRQ